MSTTIRLPRGVYEEAITHLGQRHPFAFERVGFMFARCAAASATTLLVVTSFEPVADENYVRDDTVGARINGTAIRHAMQRALSTGDSVLHVHLHDHHGPPAFSATDERELARLVPSFAAVAKKVSHGALVFSRDRASGLTWTDDRRVEPAEAVAVVGHPFKVWRPT